MYTINTQTNRINRLEQKTFAELKFKEREHLQEWIANNPSSLGEELLVIQKEFSGFNETNERLDLLAFCLLYTSPSPRDLSTSRMPSSA